jgi:hypothetical protein
VHLDHVLLPSRENLIVFYFAKVPASLIGPDVATTALSLRMLCVTLKHLR